MNTDSIPLLLCFHGNIQKAGQKQLRISRDVKFVRSNTAKHQRHPEEDKTKTEYVFRTELCGSLVRLSEFYVNNEIQLI